MVGKLELGHTICVRALLTFIVFAVCVQQVAADPLDKEACERLRTEQKALSVLGVDKFFDHGAEWVKANLTAADHNLVERYVNVFEQLKFRCSGRDGAKAKTRPVARGRVPPLPVRSPGRIERIAVPVKTAQPG